MNYIKGIRLSSIPHSEYPFNIPAVRHLNETGGITLEKPVTFLVGENGTGKTTLIKETLKTLNVEPTSTSDEDFRKVYSYLVKNKI